MEDLREYFRHFSRLPDLAGEIGAEEAAKRLAEQTQRMADAETLSRRVDAIRRRHNLIEEDARTAYWILQVYYWENYAQRRPLAGRIARFLAAMMRLKYPKPVLQTPTEVIVESPWGVACPIVKGSADDLEKCRPLCEACFRHGVIMEPDQLALLKIASPTLRLELHKFRESPDKNCEYSLVSE